MSLKVIVCGSREFEHYNYLKSVLDDFFSTVEDKDITIISGGCSGIDQLGEMYAEDNDLKMQRYPAQWKIYGKAAGPKRNREMVAIADMVIAFPKKSGRGTKSLISYANKKGIPVIINDITDVEKNIPKRKMTSKDAELFLALMIDMFDLENI